MAVERGDVKGVVDGGHMLLVLFEIRSLSWIEVEKEVSGDNPDFYCDGLDLRFLDLCLVFFWWFLDGNSASKT